MEGTKGRIGACTTSIRAIGKGDVHKICSGQVILDLSSAVKELVENSLDAGATSIDISLRDYGEESFKISDNGCGIPPHNFQGLALKYHTSKIAKFSDLQSLTTFGFRGEALSSLCALGNLSIETRTVNEPVGTHLTFDHSGVVTFERKIARPVGTTVTVEKLFSPLPVRCKEFSRNICREFGKLISLLHAYALIGKGVRMVCTNAVGKNPKSVVLQTQGSSSLKDNIIMVFGMKMLVCLQDLNVHLSDDLCIEGFLSKPGSGNGRNLGDRQFFYVNGRPVDMPKVSKLLNESYKSLNSKQYPIAILNFVLPVKEYDINVTPDKRKIFFSDESSLILALREAIENIYSQNHCTYTINTLELSKQEIASEIHCVDSSDLPSSSPVISEESKDQKGTMGPTQNSMETCDGGDLGSKMLKTSNSEGITGLAVSMMEQEDMLESSLVQYEQNHDRRTHGTKGMQIRDFGYPRNNYDNHQTFSRKVLPKRSVDNMSSFGGPKTSQSKLTNFITVSKNKHEHTCALLSEGPVLRKETTACHRNNNTLVKPSEFFSSSSSSYIAPPPNSRVDNKEKDNVSGGEDLSNTPEIITRKVLAKEFEEVLEGKLMADSNIRDSSDNCYENMAEGSNEEAEKLGSSDNVIVQTTKRIKLSADNLEQCPTLHFDISDVKCRREQRLSLFRNKTHVKMNSIQDRRCSVFYSAATMENCCKPEDEEGKSKALAAATRELERSFRKEDFLRMKVIGQFNLGFIIAKLDEDLFIIDQHTADEKYNFERLSKSTTLSQQPLLQPLRLELSPEEDVVVSLNMEIFRKNGFILKEDTDAPPGRRFLLVAVPFSKNVTFGVADVKELISSLADAQGDSPALGSFRMDTPDSLCPSRVRGMLASRACRSSVMIGDPLKRNEMQKVTAGVSI